MALEVNVDRKNATCFTVCPVGAIDTNTSVILEEGIDSVLALKPKVIVLDMSGVNFMSSAGVRVILKTKKGLEAAGGSLTMINLQPQIKKVLDIINALPSLRVFESIQELDDYLATIQQKYNEDKSS